MRAAVRNGAGKVASFPTAAYFNILIFLVGLQVGGIMIPIYVDSKGLIIQNIKKSDLLKLTQWYNEPEHYKYATGIDRIITMDELTQQYDEAANCPHDFLAGLFVKQESDMIGFIKGSLKSGRNHVLWLHSLIIESAYQRQGYGTIFLEMVLNYFKQLYQIHQVFVSVLIDNSAGIKFWSKNGFSGIMQMESNVKLTNTSGKIILMMRQFV